MRAALGQRLRRQLITATGDQATLPQPEALLDTNRYIPLLSNILLYRYRNNIIRISSQSDSCGTIRTHSILNHFINSPGIGDPGITSDKFPSTNNYNKTISKTLHWCIPLHDSVMAPKVQSLLPSGSPAHLLAYIRHGKTVRTN